MGILSRLFGRRDRKINVLAPVDEPKGIYTLTESIRVKFRPAQQVPVPLRTELLEICKSDARVSACFLLDVLEQPTGEIKFFVELRVDDPAALHDIGPRMQRVLSRYPDLALRSFVGAGTFEGLTEEQAAYRRQS